MNAHARQSDRQTNRRQTDDRQTTVYIDNCVPAAHYQTDSQTEIQTDDSVYRQPRTGGVGGAIHGVGVGGDRQSRHRRARYLWRYRTEVKSAWW